MDYFSEKEDLILLNKLNKLFDEWRESVKKENPKKAKLWTSDGFFPYYSKADKKILFIGRENRSDYNFARNNKTLLADGFINFKLCEWKKEYDEGAMHFRSQNWPRIFQIMNGIQKKCSFNKLEKPNDYLNSFFDEKNKNYMKFGFAFMEISKYVNSSADGAVVNKKLVDEFLTEKNVDFIKKEICLLNPDLIVTMNLWDSALGIKRKMDQIFIGNHEIRQLNKVKISGSNYNLLNVYHFSARKDTEEEYFKPVIKAIRKIKKIEN